MASVSQPASRRNWRLVVGPPCETDQTAVRDLAAQATAHDGVAPLSEVPLLRLGESPSWLTHIMVRRALTSDDAETPAPDSLPHQLLGYAQIDRSGETASAELVVAPAARRCGIGRVLLKTAEADARLPGHAGLGDSAGKELRVWAHGGLPAAQALAAAQGYQPVRELLLLERPLTPAPVPDLTTGYTARSFVPGSDDEAWVALNALVFADHPEQGRLTTTDLQLRMAEPWFDQAAFHLVAQPNGELTGFCWGKADEIYAIGVHPNHRRRGLAAFLLHTAFTHMQNAGHTHTRLYVEGDNEPALAAYYTAGFTPIAADVQYAKPTAWSARDLGVA